MKTFYLLRHQDVHGNSGCGVVAEGIIFDHGMGAFTWLSDIKTVTMFMNIVELEKLHGHEGKTEIIIEGKDDRHTECKALARAYKRKKNRENKDK